MRFLLLLALTIPLVASTAAEKTMVPAKIHKAPVVAVAEIIPTSPECACTVPDLFAGTTVPAKKIDLTIHVPDVGPPEEHICVISKEKQRDLTTKLR